MQELTSREGRLADVVKVFGGMFSSQLGIDLASSNKHEIGKWFLAAILFGARISEIIAIKTYKVFEENKIFTPERVLDTGWDGLVEILDRGGYVRYDFKTATKLLEVNRSLLDGYAGDLNRLHEMASDPGDLEQKLKHLGKGIGDVTVNIFLREMRGIWAKARPLPSELVLLAARDLELLPGKTVDGNESLQVLMDAWVGEGNESRDFADFEAALVRYALALRKKEAPGKRKAVPRTDLAKRMNS